MGGIKNLKVLGYADDDGMMATTVVEMTDRLTRFADQSLQQADMKVKLAKTFTQHVCVQEKQAQVTCHEVRAKDQSYKFACTFCDAGCAQRFKTAKGMMLHRASCQFNYATTEQTWEVESIVGVFGRRERWLFKIRWLGLNPEEDTWEPEHLLLRDGCKESVDAFWAQSGLNPAQPFHDDAEGRPRGWICGWASKSMEPLYLKAHIKRARHAWCRKRAHGTAKKDVLHDRHQEVQKQRGNVCWGDKEVVNTWQFVYLGSVFQTNGSHMADVARRIGHAKTRAGKLTDGDRQIVQE